MEESQAGAGEDVHVAVGLAQLDSLLAHAMRVPNELEQVWSRCLNEAQMQDGPASFNMRIRAALKAFQEQIRDSESKSGLATSLPLGEDDWKAVVERRIEDAKVREVAQIVVFAALANTIRSLQEPGITVTNLLTNESESVWEADAFARFRSTAGLLRELMHAPATGVAEIVRLLALAQRAARSGMPEAAVLYLRLSLPILASELSPTIGDDEREPDRGEVAAVAELLGGYGTAVGLIDELCRSMASGTSPDLPTASLLAFELSDRFVDLVNARVFGSGPSNA